MATGLTDSTHYHAIADAIRAKLGITETYTPEEMAAAIKSIVTGIPEVELPNQAGVEHILKGYAAYNALGDVITGEAEQGLFLEALSNPAGPGQILSGYQAYDASGNKIYGTGGDEKFVQYVEFTLTAADWNGTTFTVTTNDWKAYDFWEDIFMDLPNGSSVVNAQRVVEAGITMPYFDTTSKTDDETGVTTYTTKIVFSATKTPTEDVVVAVWNLVEV